MEYGSVNFFLLSLQQFFPRNNLLTNKQLEVKKNVIGRDRITCLNFWSRRSDSIRGCTRRKVGPCCFKQQLFSTVFTHAQNLRRSAHAQNLRHSGHAQNVRHAMTLLVPIARNRRSFYQCITWSPNTRDYASTY